MEEVVQYFEDEHHARVRSSCLSPLGLCLVQFSSPMVKEAMINMSPHQLDDVREIVVVKNDRGRNIRNCPFTGTCWIMFLGFPLDFQTREIISQTVGLFGTVLTWTSNVRCHSRILLHCKVTMINRVPRSLIICEGSAIGDNGQSWTVPVFVLNSQHNNVDEADEDHIPPNGNPHPEHAHFQFANQGNHGQGNFEDVGDLDEVQQMNEDQG